MTTAALFLAGRRNRDLVDHAPERVCELLLSIHNVHGVERIPCQRMGGIRASASGARGGGGEA